MNNTKHTYVAPRTPLEEALARNWAQVLGCERVSIKDHFQDLGGTSLHATRIFSRLKEDLGVTLSRSLILQFPTIAEMAAYIDACQHESCFNATVATTALPRKRENDRSPFSK